MKTTPYNGWKYPETTDQAKIPSHVEGFLLPIDAIIAQLLALAGLNANPFADQLNAVKWNRGNIANPAADTVTSPGIYNVTASSGSANLPEKVLGTLQVHGTDAYLMQIFYTYKTGILQIWIRRRSGTTWEAWQPIRWIQGNIAKGTDLDTLTTDGLYIINATVTNWPDGQTGVLEVMNGGGIQRYTSRNNRAFTRAYVGGAWTDWAKIATSSDLSTLAERVSTLETATGGGSGSAFPVTTYSGANRGLFMSRAYQEIAPRQSSKGQVALVCDHGTIAFKDMVFPKLKALGLTCTLALNSSRLDTDYAYRQYELDTWDDVKYWKAQGIEIANHGRTHKDWSAQSDIIAEIVQGKNDLETAINGSVHSFIQPGAIGDLGKWGGFQNGLRYSSYATTLAGQLILDQHPFISGSIWSTTKLYPLRGEPVIGANGFWIDGSDGIAPAKQAVQDAAAQKKGVLIRMHPQAIGVNNTADEVLGFLDFLKAQKDSGAVDVVTFAQWNMTEIVSA